MWCFHINYFFLKPWTFRAGSLFDAVGILFKQ